MLRYVTLRYVMLSCKSVQHNTAQNSSDNLPSYPPDNNHCSDVVYRKGAVMKNGDSRLLLAISPSIAACSAALLMMTRCASLCSD